MTTRTITGNILHSDGTVWPNYPVKFWRSPESYTASSNYPEDAITALTNSSGDFSLALWVNTEGIVGSTYICQLHDEDFMFNLPPGAPVNINQLRGVAPGLAGIAPTTLSGWAAGEEYELTAITYNGTYTNVIATATVKWPDGSAGVFTTTTVNTTWQDIDAYTITHALSGKTVTQALVTRNANGDVTAKPALTVS